MAGSVLEDVRAELRELERIGIKVPHRANEFITRNAGQLLGLHESGMRIREIADYVRDVA